MHPARVLNLLLLLALACGLAPALHASEVADRAWQQLDDGNPARARWLFEQALTQSPCDANLQQGLAQAGGSPLRFQKLCPGSAAAPAAEAAPAAATPVEAATAQDAASGADGDATKAPASAAADQAQEAPEAAAAASAGSQEQPHPLLRSRTFWLGILGFAILALAAVWVPWRRLFIHQEAAEAPAVQEIHVPPSLVKLVAQHEAAARSEAAAAPAPPAPEADVASFLSDGDGQSAAPSAPVAVQQAAQSAAPHSVAASLPAAAPRLEPVIQETSLRPFGPTESVRFSLKAGAEEVVLTDKKLYWTGTRALPGFFGRRSREAPVTVAVPFDQITGLAWARPKGGDLLVIGTVMAGDIGLQASLHGAAPLQAFAQALSEAMDRES